MIRYTRERGVKFAIEAGVVAVAYLLINRTVEPMQIVTAIAMGGCAGIQLWGWV